MTATDFLSTCRELVECIANVGSPHMDNPVWLASATAAKRVDMRLIRRFLEHGELPQPEPTVNPVYQIAQQAHRIRLLTAAPVKARWQQRLAEGWQPDYLFHAHFDRRSWDRDGNYCDIFFRPAMELALAEGKQILVVGQTACDEHEVRDALAAHHHPALELLPLELFMRPTDAPRARLLQARQLPFIGPCPLVEGKDPQPLLQHLLDNDQRTGDICRNLCYYLAYRRLADHLHGIQRAFWQWENQCWERLFMHVMRAQAPNLRLLGYQHSTVKFRTLHHFPGTADLDTAPWPDRIFTTGPAASEALESVGTFPPDMLMPSCAMRFQHLETMTPISRQAWEARRTIGLCLHIERPISLSMLQMAIDAWGEASDQPVCVRCHPLLPADVVRHLIPRDIPAHFTFSDHATMSEYLEQLANLIYCDSTVGFEALLKGIPAIYLDIGDGLAGDPLFALHALKGEADSAQALRQVHQRLAATSPQAYREQQEQARTFINRFFTPVTAERLRLFFDG